jgi:hypothetical protein
VEGLVALAGMEVVARVTGTVVPLAAATAAAPVALAGTPGAPAAAMEGMAVAVAPDPAVKAKGTARGTARGRGAMTRATRTTRRTRTAAVVAARGSGKRGHHAKA